MDSIRHVMPISLYGCCLNRLFSSRKNPVSIREIVDTASMPYK